MARAVNLLVIDATVIVSAILLNALYMVNDRQKSTATSTYRYQPPALSPIVIIGFY
jgi:hypothetical protein